MVALHLNGQAKIMFLTMLEFAKVLNSDFKPMLAWLKDPLLQVYGSVDRPSCSCMDKT
jgi:hypothetical protein